MKYAIVAAKDSDSKLIGIEKHWIGAIKKNNQETNLLISNAKL